MQRTAGQNTRRWAASTAKPRWRSTAANCRLVFFLLALVVGIGVEVRAHVGEESVQTGGSSAVRTVMDLMQAMLNRDILDMLANGGYDFRQPARIFLPPKFYSSVPLDRGHMSPEEILSALSAPLQPSSRGGEISAPSSPPRPSSSLSSSSSLPIGGKANHQKVTAAGDDAFGRRGFGGKEQVVVLDAPDGSRFNLISYSDGKVTSTVGAGEGTAAGSNKGSGSLEKNAGTNVKPSVARDGSTRKANQGQRPLTTSITDQTVSPNVARTSLPTSGRFAGNGRSSSHGETTGSTTDRLRSALPGEPDVDYPILGSVPATTFTCDKRHPGYYADVEARCQVFRVCANTDSTGRGFAFLCPNGTLFNQRHLVCDWYMNVRCADSENYYQLNEQIGRMVGADAMAALVGGNRRDMMEVVMAMVTYPMRSLMELMDGVGVLEERGVGLEPAVPPTRVTGSPGTGSVGPSTFLTPVRTELQPPFRSSSPVESARELVPANKYAPVASPSVRPKQENPNRVNATPALGEVYVSSLGTLSTDPNSGFDPERSTLLTRTEGVASGYVGQAQVDRVSAKTPPIVSYSGPTEIQLVKADLLKTWNGPDSAPVRQLPPLRSTSVPTSYQQSSFPRTQPQQFVGRFQLPTPVAPQPLARQDLELLPPTGVLPPTSFTRTVGVGSTQTAAQWGVSPVGYSDHRFTPVRKVLSVQKVTVLPQYSYQPSRLSVASQAASGPHTRTGVVDQHQTDRIQVTTEPLYQNHQRQGTLVQPSSYVHQQNFYRTPNPAMTSAVQGAYVHQPSYVTPAKQYHTATGSIPHRYGAASGASAQARPSVDRPNIQTSSQAQLLRRNDELSALSVPRESGPLFHRKSTVLVQVVPSVGFYLNDAQEKQAYDEAVRRGLLDERQRSVFTSYDVPQGSVGQLSL